MNSFEMERIYYTIDENVCFIFILVLILNIPLGVILPFQGSTRKKNLVKDCQLLSSLEYIYQKEQFCAEWKYFFQYHFLFPVLSIVGLNTHNNYFTYSCNYMSLIIFSNCSFGMLRAVFIVDIQK